MKRTLKLIGLVFCLFFLHSQETTAQSGPGTNFFGINVEPLCWVVGSTDSTIYASWLNKAGTGQPTLIGYFNAAGNNVVVSTGTLYPGYCNGGSGGGGGPCPVQGEWRVESITSNTTYNTNTYNSIAIQAVSGTITVNVDGAGAVTIAVGTILTVRADACQYVQSSVVVGVTGGSALISRYF